MAGDTSASAVVPVEGRQALARHIMLLAAFSVAAVIIRGVRWDETYERAQILIGLVQYPAGHPLLQYAHNAYSLQYHLAAWILRLIPSAAFLCGARQALAICATTIPVFLLANLISRRILPGYIAAMLALAGSLRAFASYYPIFDWPDKFTCGHIGMGFMLLVLYFTLRGRTGIALFGLSAAPAIHVGQTPVLAVIVGFHTLARVIRERDRRWIRRALPLLILGVAVSAGTWLYINANKAIPPASGPYAEDPHTATDLWRGYSHGEDIHRVFPRFNPNLHSHIIAAIAISLGTLALCRMPRQQDRQRMAWLLTYCVAAACAFYGVMAAERFLGDSRPPMMTIWMPYRLMNHIAVICLALAVGITGSVNFGLPALAIAAAYPVAAFASSFIIPDALWQRYFNAPEATVFFLTGSAAAILTQDIPRKRLALFVFPLALLAVYHQFGAACLVLGFLLTRHCVAATKQSSSLIRSHSLAKLVDAFFFVFKSKIQNPKSKIILLAFLLLFVLITLGQQYATRRHMPATTFQTAVSDYLKTHAQPADMLVVPHWDIDYQETTGHPVLYTFETPQLLTYMPQIAPPVISIRRDIYDIVLGRMWDYSLDAWKTRTTDQWRTLANQYGFTYIVSPNAVPLPLTPVLTDPHHTLYQVPATQ